MLSATLTQRIPADLLNRFAATYLLAACRPVGAGPLADSFQLYSRQDARCREQLPYARGDYFKISLVTAGTGWYTYGTRRYAVAAPALLLTVPALARAWEATSAQQEGYFCLFSEDFLPAEAGLPLYRHPLFTADAAPVLPLSPAELPHFQDLFQHLAAEYQANHSDRRTAVQLYLRLLLLAAQRVASQPVAVPSHTAARELSARFLTQLARQFPVRQPTQVVVCTTAVAFAQRLAVHPTYLNTCVKQTTGRTVSAHIQGHLLQEASRLLLETSWPVAWIAAALGFREAAYFARVYRKYTGYSPRQRRAMGIV